MAQRELYKFRSSEEFKEKWVQVCEDLRMSQNETFLALAEFFIRQDQLTREAIIRRGSKVKLVVKR